MKPNKILHGVMTLMLASAALVSCTDDVKFGNDALDKASGSEATLESVFSNAEFTKQFLVGIYARQYYGLPYVNSSALPHSCNPYAGKFDALTDCWHMGWTGAAVFGQYYQGALTSNVKRSDGLDGPLFSYDKEHVWEAVRAGNIFLEHVDEVPGLTDAEKGCMKAEARCLIAARMFDCFQHYGGIPIMDHAITVDETTAEFPRKSVEECVNYMVGLLNQAIAEPNFPWVTADPATMSGRWTRAGARALKAKILQFAASPLFNPQDGQPYYAGASEEVKPFIMYTDASKYNQRWADFKTACDEFFADLAANDWYKLEQADIAASDNARVKALKYRLAYRKGYALRESTEILHSTRHQGYDSYSAGRYCWHSWYTGSVPRNLYWPTQEYVEKFPYSNGQPFDWTTAYNNQYNTDGSMKLDGSGNPIANRNSLNGMFITGDQSALQQLLRNVQHTRDPRLYEECIVNGTQKHLDWTTAVASGEIWELWDGGTDALQGIHDQTGMFGTGYGFNKYYMGDGTSGSGDNIRYQTQWVYLSLSEMYLMDAEAKAMSGDLTGALAQMDVVRKRVGLTNNVDYYDATLRTDKDKLIEEILNERARELGLQNARWFDMIRYKRTDWMTKQLHRLEMHRLKKNSVGNWVESNTQWTNGDKKEDPTSRQPKYFSYKIQNITANTRALWGKDPNSNEVRKWLLTPFPQAEINKGYGLIQNPGW